MKHLTAHQIRGFFTLAILSPLTSALLHTPEDPSCQWGPLQHPIYDQPQCLPFSSSPTITTPNHPPRNITREGWSRLGWDGPNDCLPTQPDYCTYTKLTTPSSDSDPTGMVVISTENSMLAIAATPPISPTEKPQLEPGAFYSAHVPGKGIGLIANRTIRKGETIMRRLPTLLIQFDMPGLDAGPGTGNELTGDERMEMYDKAVARMDERTRESFNSQVGEDVVGKVDRNSFRMFVDGDEGHLGAYPDVARLNHDCRPNVHYRITNLTHITVAVRDIPAGEELTVSYIDGMILHAERQDRLDSWGFKCACQVCSQGLAEIAASDARVKEIAKIEAELEEKVGSGEDIPLDMGDRLVRLYEEEGLDNYLAHALTKAALLASMVGDGEKTREYAMLAVEALEREYGPGSKDGEAMLELAGNMEEHWSWGIRMGGWKMG